MGDWLGPVSSVLLNTNGLSCPQELSRGQSLLKPLSREDLLLITLKDSALFCIQSSLLNIQGL